MTKRWRGPLYMSGVVASGLNAAVVWPVAGRLLSTSEIGEISALLAAAAIGAPVATIGMHVYVLRTSAIGLDDDRATSQQVARWVTGALMAVGVLGAIGMVAGIPYASIVLLASVGGQALTASALARGTDRPAIFALGNFAVLDLSLLLLAIVSAITNNLNWGIVAYATVVSAAAALTVVGASEGRAVRMPRAPLRFSAPLLPHLVLTLAIPQGTRVAVAAVAGSVLAASYQFAAIVGGAVLTVVGALAGHWGTDLLRKSDNDFLGSVPRLMERLLSSAVVLQVLVLLFAEFALGFWLPPGISETRVHWAILLMLPAATAQAVAEVAGIVAMRQARTGVLSTSTLAGVLIGASVFASTLGVGFGAIAAGATAISSAGLVRCVTIYLLLGRLMDVRLFWSGRAVKLCAISTLIVLSAVIGTSGGFQ